MPTFDQWKMHVKYIPVKSSDVDKIAQRLVDLESTGQKAGAWHESMSFYRFEASCPCFRCMTARGETEAQAGKRMREARKALRNA